MKNASTFCARHSRPGAAPQRVTRGRHGSIDFRNIGFGNFCENLLVGRIERGKAFAARRFAPFAADQQAQRHFR
jgi:hypothetical protein